ncbi:hypothetical protein BS78_07G162900 [Paspalum vaginatum]|nr:hypothetical protein BS78_07G162900 [Paspalum vaginatum]
MDLARHLRHAVGAVLLAEALLLSAAVPPCAGATEFTYVPNAPNGPENWGTFKPEWAECSAGQMQSPIDLSDDNATLVRSLGYLDYSYRPALATIINTGHDIKVIFKGDAGSLRINGTVYPLKQLHWHTPSEHTIDGRRYDMEVHLVHITPENKIAVVGVLYKVNLIFPDLFLKKLEPFIVAVAATRDQELPIGLVDPNDAACTGCVYYRYMGSLTTPPCTEGVIWTVCKKVRPVQKSQIDLLQGAVDPDNKMNARPLQPLNNRDINVFRPLLKLLC